MPEIIVYATSSCPYCSMAKKLLDGKGLKYTIINASAREVWLEMEQKSGRNTVPQTFIGNTHIGGFDDLSAAENSGKLDEIIKAESK